MWKITIKIDGMHCGMCESRVNELIRRAANVKKVSSSHAKGQTVILSEEAVDEEFIKRTLETQGYHVLSIEKEPYVKKGFFNLFRK